MQPARAGARRVLRVQHAVPTGIGAEGFAFVEAGEIVPLLVVIFVVAVGAADPDHLRHGVGHFAETHFAGARRVRNLVLFVDVGAGAVPAGDASFRVALGRAAHTEPTVLPV